jgi:hypothetical protein
MNPNGRLKTITAIIFLLAPNILLAAQATEPDSLAAEEVKLPQIEKMQESRAFFLRTYRQIDTSLAAVHRFSAGGASREYGLSLGQIGRPMASLDLRNKMGRAAYMPFIEGFNYFGRADKMGYYDTKSPYTQLQYSRGQSREQNILAMHTQNSGPYLNLGFSLNFFNGEGTYLYESHTSKVISGHAVYSAPRMKSRLFMNFNQRHQDENGGYQIIEVSDGVINHMPKLTGHSSLSDYSDISHEQEYNMARSFTAIDSAMGDTEKFRFYAGHKLAYSYSARRYSASHTRINNAYFSQGADTVLIGPRIGASRQASIHRKLELGAYAGASRRISRALFVGAQVSAGTDIDSYIMPDSAFTSQHHQFVSPYFEAMFYSKLGKAIVLEAAFRNYYAGRRANDRELEARAYAGRAETNKVNLDAGIMFSQASPNLFYEKYHSVYYKWDTKLLQEISLAADAGASIPAMGLRLSGFAGSVTNAVYMGGDAKPKQYGSTLPMFGSTLGYSKEAKNLFAEASFTAQRVFGNANVYRAPELYCYGSLGAKGHLASQKIEFRTGADFYASSAYSSYSYMPATGTFYAHNAETAIDSKGAIKDNKLHPLPDTDLFLNFKLKRGRASFKYTNIAQLILNLNNRHQTQRPMSRSIYGQNGYRPQFVYSFAWHFYD